MDTAHRTEGITAKVGVTALVFTTPAAIALIAAPLSLEAPFLGILVTGSDSALTVAGSFAAVLLLAGVVARTILRMAVTRWPELEPSFRLGVVIVPVVALSCLLVPETVHQHASLMAMLSLPAVFAVATGAATAWIARPR